MATKFYRELQESEFDRPDKIDQGTVDLAYLVRRMIGLPMILTQDACSPDSTSHARYSLHKWGIDHRKSEREKRLVLDVGAKGKALDFYFIRHSVRPVDVLDDLLRILVLTNWGGVGIYPDWRPYPGLHLDTRTPSHRTYRYWWIGYKDDGGRQSYIYNPTSKHLQRFIHRGFMPNGGEW